MEILKNIQSMYNLSKIVIGRKTNYSKIMYPVHLTYLITKKCNSRCIMCNIWKEKKFKKELTIEELRELGKSKYLKNVLFLGVSGGEPFLRKDLVESIIALTKNMKKIKQISFSTNGLLQKKIENDIKKLLKFKKKIRIDLSVSVEGRKDKNDKIRGIKGGYKKALETIDALKKIKNNRLDISLRLAILPSNYKEIPKLYKLANEKNIGFICKPATSGGLYQNEEEFDNWSNKFTEKEKEKSIEYINRIVNDRFKKIKKKKGKGFEKIKKIAYNLFLKYSTNFIKNPNKLVFPCYALFSSVMLEYEGSIYSCPVLYKKMGNIREKKFDDIWKGKNTKEIRRFIKKGKCPCYTNCNQMIPLVLSKSPEIIYNFIR